MDERLKQALADLKPKWKNSGYLKSCQKAWDFLKSNPDYKRLLNECENKITKL